MLCKDLMKIEVECVSPQTSVQDAACRMRDRNIGFLPVCDSTGRVLGTVTDRDIAIRFVAEDGFASDEIEGIYTDEVIACRPEDDVGYAREMMSQNQKSRIMCVDPTGRLRGVISLSDIVELDEQAGAATLRDVSARENRAGENRLGATM